MVPELNAEYRYTNGKGETKTVTIKAITKGSDKVRVSTPTNKLGFNVPIDKLEPLTDDDTETTGEATTTPPPVANPFPTPVPVPTPTVARKTSKTGAKTMFKRIETDFCRPHAEIHHTHETLTGERLIRVPMTPDEDAPTIVTCPEMLGDVLSNLELSWRLADVEADWLESFRELVVEREDVDDDEDEDDDQGDGDPGEDDDAFDKITASVGQSSGPRQNAATAPTAGKTIPGKLSARASKHARSWAVGEKRRKADGSLILADGNGKLPKDVLRDWFVAHPEMKDEILTWQ